MSARAAFGLLLLVALGGHLGGAAESTSGLDLDDSPFETSFYGVREVLACSPGAHCSPGWYCNEESKSGEPACERCWSACVACASQYVNRTAALQKDCDTCQCGQHSLKVPLPLPVLGNTWPNRNQQCGNVSGSGTVVHYSSCGTLGFCSKQTGRCASCYDLIHDNDTWYGNGEQACGFISRSHYPTYGLPFDAANPARYLWVVDALAQSVAFFTAVLGFNSQNSTALITGTTLGSAALPSGLFTVAHNPSELKALLDQAALGDLVEDQVRFAFAQADVDGDGLVRPEEWALAFVVTRDRYSVICPPDALAQLSGLTWPGCTCTYVADQAATLARNKTNDISKAIMAKVLALQNQLSPEAMAIIRNLTGGDATAQGWNLSAPVQCVAGYRCSRSSFLHMAGALPRRSASIFNGICAPCQIGEYCPVGTVELGVETVINCASEFQDEELRSLMRASQAGAAVLEENKVPVAKFIDEAARMANVSLPGGMNASQLVDRIVNFFGNSSGGSGAGGAPPQPASNATTAEFLASMQRELNLSNQTMSDLVYLAGVVSNGTWREGSFWQDVITNGTRPNDILRRLVETYTLQPLLLPAKVQFGVATACNMIMPCPAGYFCPTPDQLKVCGPGTFCTLSMVRPASCDVVGLMKRNPALSLQQDPQRLIDGIGWRGLPLQGNMCLNTSHDPYTGCPKGYYCPNSGVQIICPAGNWCPARTTEPQACTKLMSCGKEGTMVPRLAPWAIALLMLMLVMVPTLFVLSDVALKRNHAAKRAEEKQLAALAALGLMDMHDPDSAMPSSGPARPARPAAAQAGRASNHLAAEQTSLLLSPNGQSAKLPHSGMSSFTMATRRIHSALRPHSVTLPRPEEVEEEEEEEDESGYEGAAAEGAAAAAAGGVGGAAGAAASAGGASSALTGEVWPRISVQFKGLGLQLNGIKGPSGCVLKDVTGEFANSAMHAVMGPSGSGKSSFLAALTGRAPYAAVSGSVAMSSWQHPGDPGQSCTPEQVKLITGWVPQDDLLHGTLSVHENLMFSARLRLPRGTTPQERSALVQQVLKLVGLSHVAHSIVGTVEKRGISGGQRKRASIALELVTRPSLLFLDEPTSGLDAATSNDVLGALKTMSLRGMCVAMVIHQPRFSIFEMFDTVLLLGTGGRTVYMGPSNMVLSYFTDGLLGFRLPDNENPADFFLDVLTGVTPREGDEDFVPRELYDLWAHLGPQWVNAQTVLRQQLEQQQQYPGPNNATAHLTAWGTIGSLHAGALSPTAPSFSSRPWAAGAATLPTTHSGGAHALAAPPPQPSTPLALSCPTVVDADTLLVRLRGGDSTMLRGAAARRAANEMHRLGSLRVATMDQVSVPSFAAASPGAHPRQLRLQDAIQEEGDEGDSNSAPNAVAPLHPAMPALRLPNVPSQQSAAFMSSFVTSDEPSLLVSQTAQVRMLLAAKLSDQQQQQQQQPWVVRASRPEDRLGLMLPPIGSRKGSSVVASAGEAQLPGSDPYHPLAAPGAPAPAASPFSVASGNAAPHNHTTTTFDVRTSTGGNGWGPAGGGGGIAGSASRGYSGLPEPRISNASGASGPPGSLRVKSHFTHTYLQRETALRSLQASTSPALPWLPRDMQVVVDRFNELDKNGDGSLTLEEFTALFSSLRTVSLLTEEQVKALVARILLEFNVKGTQPITRSQFLAAVKTRLILADLAAKGAFSDPDADDPSLPQLRLDEKRQELLRNVLQQMFPADAKSGTARITLLADQDEKPPAGVADAATATTALPLSLAPLEVEEGPPEGAKVAKAKTPWTKVAAENLWELWAALTGQAYGGRQLSPAWAQAYVVMQRSAKKTLNSAREVLLLDLAVLAVATLVLGAVQGHPQTKEKLPSFFAMGTTAFAMFCTIAGLRSSSGEQHMYVVREAPGGLTTLAYLAGRMTWDVLMLPLYPAVFLMSFYATTAFSTPWGLIYGTLLQVAWYATGMGYVIASVLGPATAMTAAALASLLFGATLNGLEPSLAAIHATKNYLLLIIVSVGYARWALEALIVNTLLPTSQSNSLVMLGMLTKLGYCGFDRVDRMAPNTTSSINMWDAALESIEQGGGLAELEEALIEAQLSGNSDTQRQARFMFNVYQDPSMLQQQCAPALALSATMLMLLGLGFRIITHVVLWCKVNAQVRYHR